MTDQLVRGLVALLQAEPLAYRNFGFYWWFVKDELRRANVSRDELPQLGDYTDDEAMAWYRTRPAKQLLTEALEYQQQAAFEHYMGTHHGRPISAGGGTYVVYDGDME